VEKVEESAHETVFTDVTLIGEKGSKTFQGRFYALNDVFLE